MFIFIYNFTKGKKAQNKHRTLLFTSFVIYYMILHDTTIQTYTKYSKCALKDGSRDVCIPCMGSEKGGERKKQYSLL